MSMTSIKQPEVVDLSEVDSPLFFRAAVASHATIDLLDDDYDDEYVILASKAKKRRKENHSQRTIHTLQFKSDPNERSQIMDDDDGIEVVKVEPGDQDSDLQIVQVKASSALNQVLEVFPDAETSHVEHLLTNFSSNVAMVLAHLAENSYPKQAVPQLHSNAADTLIHDDTGRKWTYDFMSKESFVPSEQYMVEAAEKLKADFPFLSSFGRSALIMQCSGHYAIAHDKLWAAAKALPEAIGDEDAEVVQFHLIHKMLSGIPLTTEQSSAVVHVTACERAVLKRPRKRIGNVIVTDPILEEEIAFVQAKTRQWCDWVGKKIQKRQNKEIFQRNGTAVECSCCFDEFAPVDMIPCKLNGHLFCDDCVVNWAENQIFGAGNLGVDRTTKKLSLELQCFHGEGCSSGFSTEALKTCLPARTFKKYEHLQFQISAERAGLTSLFSCPKCGFQAELPPSQKVFSCPIDNCRYESCRECGEASHIPFRCEEVEKEAETKGRLTVEEAISDAKIRRCPKCKRSFVKEYGCNKVRCSCGTTVCYICRQVIADYKHFCQKPHCQHNSCNMCPLHTNAEEDDARAMREAGIRAAQDVHNDSLTKPNQQNGSAATGIQIDVDSILKNP